MPERIDLNLAARAAAAIQPGSSHQGATPAGTPAFADLLDQAKTVHFSNHAQQRLASRNINLGQEAQAQLADAIDRAAQRGGKQSLVLMDDLSFIVNVPNRTVVTAMDGTSRKEGVFTQIDSVVLAYKK